MELRSSPTLSLFTESGEHHLHPISLPNPCCKHSFLRPNFFNFQSFLPFSTEKHSRKHMNSIFYPSMAKSSSRFSTRSRRYIQNLQIYYLFRIPHPPTVLHGRLHTGSQICGYTYSTQGTITSHRSINSARIFIAELQAIYFCLHHLTLFTFHLKVYCNSKLAAGKFRLGKVRFLSKIEYCNTKRMLFLQSVFERSTSC